MHNPQALVSINGGGGGFPSLGKKKRERGPPLIETSACGIIV